MIQQKANPMALHFELVSPARLLFSGDVVSVQIPGAEGEMTILPGHAPVLSTLLLVLAGFAPAHWTLALACALIVGGAALASRSGRQNA